MKRYQLRQELNVTDAQLRKAIAQLNLSAADTHSYTSEEIDQIKALFDQTPNQSQPQPQPQPQYSNHYPQNITAAAEAQTQAQIAIQSASRAGLENVAHYIQRTAEQRQIGIQKASDTIAYLHDPLIFTAEALMQASAKLQAPGKLDIDCYTIDIQAYQFPSLPVYSGQSAELPQAG